MLRRLDQSEFLADFTGDLRQRIQASKGQPLVVQGQPGTGRSRVLAQLVKEVVGGILIRVPPTLDQTERVLLEIADHLGDAARQNLDAALRRSADDLAPSLQALDRHLGGRPLFVDDIDLAGAFGLEREVGSALQDRAFQLRTWLIKRSLLATARRTPEQMGEERLVASPHPPAALANGAILPTERVWQDLRPDVRTYELVLTWMAVADDQRVPESYDEDDLRRSIVERLPPRLERLLRALSLHGRPLPEALAALSTAAEGPAFAEGERLGLWRRTPRGLLTDGEWGLFYGRSLPAAEHRAQHLQLAVAFSSVVRPADPEEWRGALSLLEAHRHFVFAGDLARARGLVRYNVALLVETARELSLAQEHLRAADLYDQILRDAEAGHYPLGRRLRAYVTHYRHFNRAHAGAESLSDTAQGFRRSLDQWPENALFWSRLVRADFYREDQEAALRALREARAAVPAHPGKDMVLVARTVRGLLRHDQLVPALEVWGDFQARLPFEREVEETLVRRLREGWSTKSLLVPGEAPVFLSETVTPTIQPVASEWACSLGALEIAARGPSPVAAYQAAVRALRAEVQRLLCAYAHELEEDDRRLKQRLLRTVDIVASRLDADAPTTTWVFGDLVRREDQTLWLKTCGTFERWFPIPDQLVNRQQLWPDNSSHFARVQAGRSGEPIGPVIEVEGAFRRPEHELLLAWKKRLRDVE